MKQVESFAKRLRELIEERDMTYEALSKATGIKPQTLNRWALGQRTPKVTAINPVAESFGVNPLWLFGYDVPKEPPVYVDGSATLSGSVSLSFCPGRGHRAKIHPDPRHDRRWHPFVCRAVCRRILVCPAALAGQLRAPGQG